MKGIINLISCAAFSLFSAACASQSQIALDPAGKEPDGKSEFFVPHKQLTSQPGWHWFAYYDKLETDPSQRYMLAMRVNFEGRTPTENDTIEVGMVDLKDESKWTKLGDSHAWGWQQGCQLQFIPQSDCEVIWNDREGDAYVSRIKNVKTGEVRTLPRPVYALSPDGKWAITVDYSRVNDMRPGYGYKGIPDKFAGEKAPSQSGIWKMDLKTGESKLIISIADAVAIPNKLDPEFKDAKHWFNHLLVSPDGRRFIFLNRWSYPDAARNEKYKRVGGFGTRMFTSDADGKNLRAIDPYNYTSHFIWEPDCKRVLAWTRIPPHGSAFFSIADSDREDVKKVGEGSMPVNGHQTFLKDPKWVLCDTYPDKGRFQTVYLFNTKTGRRIDIAKLYSPPAYKGEWRCDTHPRATPDGKFVTVDSPHNGGRQVYLLDISEVLKNND